MSPSVGTPSGFWPSAEAEAISRATNIGIEYQLESERGSQQNANGAELNIQSARWNKECHGQLDRKAGYAFAVKREGPRAG